MIEQHEDFDTTIADEARAKTLELHRQDEILSSLPPEMRTAETRKLLEPRQLLRKILCQAKSITI